MGKDIMCCVEGCGRLASYKTKRLCSWHYNQAYYALNPDKARASRLLRKRARQRRNDPTIKQREAEEVKAHHQAMLQKYFPDATIS